MPKTHFASSTSKRPQTYYPLDNEQKAMLFCPKCSGRFTLDKHTINKSGEVHASLVCPHHGCDFHEWGVLDNWSIGS